MLRVTVRARAHHPWIFSNEVLDPPVARLPAGGAVEVVDARGRLLGRGYANPHSLISIRIYARADEDPDDPALYVARLRRAAAWRARVFPERDALRVCAGEADGLPGLLVDRYGDILSVQITTLGMQTRADLVLAALREVFAPRGIVAKNDVGLRQLEGLPLESQVWWGEVPDRVAFGENGVRYEADLVGGQKTGFFFDQAENRAWMASRVRGARVLDLYAHLGAWALTALRHGAASAVAVDSSAAACAAIRHNAERNGLAVEVLQADAREAMAKLGGGFDCVFVDPPAFAKNRKSAGVALGAYKAVNAAAARLVVPGGLLFASSCSHHVLPERFEEAVVAGIRSAGRRALLLRRAGAAADHPVLPGVPETEYLKHRVFVVDG